MVTKAQQPGGRPDADAESAGAETIYTVSRLNQEVRELLEDRFPRELQVEGELSNLARPSSGHLYFSLKDSEAAVRCAMFRRSSQLLRFEPRDGMQVLVRVRVSLYEMRGAFQLIVESMEVAGAGRLRIAFEELKQSLNAEGLFDPSRKCALPEQINTIGVLTSQSGAALRDVLSVLRRRYPLARVVLYPVPVQGPEAAPALARMLGIASERAECDVLLLVRGGGSLEDLQPFNEEQTARAIAACELPLVSGVGHEIDYSIADLVADLRAPTPSAAAELVSPNQVELRQLLATAQAGLDERLREFLDRGRETLSDWTRRLRQPHRRTLENVVQTLDEQELRLRRAVHRRFREERKTLFGRERILSGAHRCLDSRKAVSASLQRRLAHLGATCLQERSLVLRGLADTLTALDPKRVLHRGYAILRRKGRVLRSAGQISAGNFLEAEFAEGGAILKVLKALPGKPSA